MGDASMAPSRSEARRLIRGGGVYLNGARVVDRVAVVGRGDLIEDRFVVVRVGKRRYFVVEVE